jgi:7-cyano-7-deazaguanine synthase in queuosine biosynthesis
MLEADGNLITGERSFTKAFGKPTTLESDLLLLGSAIFAADRATQRGQNEDISRSFVLDIPVVNIARLLPLIPVIETVLRQLSQDGWEIKFRPIGGAPESDFKLPSAAGRTLLFSGGLDSLAAAIEFGRDAKRLGLVSHKTHNRVTDQAQQKLFEMLQADGFSVDHLRFFVSSRDGGPTNIQHDVENSQRTRSFVFLILGALAARRTGRYEIVYLAENGQLAIHLPLNHGRVGAFSTHTAHPDVLAGMSSFLSKALGTAFSITNPYVIKTKKEVVTPITKELPQGIPIATSCWRNARLPGSAKHCGECIPCYVRRIALEGHGTDPTKYARDPWTEVIADLDNNDDGRRNLIDLIEFVRRFRDFTDADLMSEFPELYSNNIDAPGVIAMYRRFAGEAWAVLSKYSSLHQAMK